MPETNKWFSSIKDIDLKLNELNSLSYSKQRVDIETLNNLYYEQHINGMLSYYSEKGYTTIFTSGEKVREHNANYIEFDTMLKDSNGSQIKGFLHRNKNTDANYIHLYWATNIKDVIPYKMGQLHFNKRENAIKFINRLKVRAMNEYWGESKEDDMPHPILISYISHIVKKLKFDEPRKFLINNKGDKILFNSNLFDDKLNEIYIAGKIGKSEQIINAFVVEDMIRLRDEDGFNISNDQIERKVPIVEGPIFVEKITDLIYQNTWAIKMGEQLNHVISRCRKRIGNEMYSKLPTESLAMLLKNSIEFAQKLSRSNYRFIVPQYRFDDETDSWEGQCNNRIQLLMPIYLDCNLQKIPDAVLILDPEEDTKTYCPKTVLTIDQVYRNARLIAKPNEEWLNITK